MNVVFDFGGVGFNWQLKVLQQQVLPRHAPTDEAAQQLAARLFQGFVPGSDWARFDLGQIEPDALAHRIAKHTARFGVDGKDTVFIDDVWHNIQAAQRHGWHGVHFQSAELAQRWPA